MTTNANKVKQYNALRAINVCELAELKTIAESAETDENNFVNFRISYQRLTEIYGEFKKNHASLITLLATIEDSNLDNEESIRAQFEQDYLVIRKIHFKLCEADSPTKPLTLVKSQENSQRNIRLNKITLPKFTGDFTKFKTFIDTFDSLVHNNSALSDIEKFHHLYDSLVGPPLTVVQCVPLTADNYAVAYNSLNKRYHNKRLMATAYLRKIDETVSLNEATANTDSLRNLVDTFEENLAALDNLDFPVAEWDFLLFYMLKKRLDKNTITQFELNLTSNNETVPTFEELKSFIAKQCNALDNIDSQVKPKSSSFNKNKFIPPKTIKRGNASSFVVNTGKLSCGLCKSEHSIYQCESFNRKSPHERYEIVKSHNWCVNCLGSKHTSKYCQSSSVCRICKQKHHSLLHFGDISTQPRSDNSEISQSDALVGMTSTKSSVLLSTALVQVLDSRQNYQTIRVLIDCGSQANFISEKCARRLGLPRLNMPMSIHGVGSTKTTSTSSALSCSLRPIDNPLVIFNIDAMILPSICSDIPTTTFPTKPWSHISHLKLSDPDFNKPGKIDMLLAADIFPLILENGKVIGGPGEPIALNTVFGWILMGKMTHPAFLSPKINSFFCQLDSALDTTIKRFWEIEELPASPKISPKEEQCERIFMQTTIRNSQGRFVVSLPFQNIIPDFGDTRSLALRRFFSIERKLLRDPALHQNYSDFMMDYLKSGHMNILDNPPLENSYYIPHHCVIKPESTTTKLRVVFDASAKLPDKPSLNDSLLIGEKLQKDIVTILLNFRSFSYVFSADIKQMYRQILINPEHTSFQRILWRFSPDDPVKDYQLNTVTYGVSSAPFLALRTLKQLALDGKDQFPLASQTLLSDIYVDDIVTGCNSLEEALTLQNQLITLLNSAGFELRKWASSHEKLLSHLPLDHLNSQAFSFDLEPGSCIKILGLQWHPSSDSFSYNVKVFSESCTKRTILSELARIFDPLGFLAPLTFSAKVLIQQLWSLGLGWDDSPPSDVLLRWNRFKSELPELSKLYIPRHINLSSSNSCDIHGFCDASEKGYAAIVYFVSKIKDASNPSLICAKSKVAPLKRISIPRLELCAAVLLADLISFVVETYKGKIYFKNTYAWSDSTITLAWIKSSPHKWKTFVSNRVTSIQEKTSPSMWRHVPTHLNPADCASRGMLPSDLITHSLWWTGPPFLTLPESSWPTSPVPFNETHLEERKIVLAAFDDSHFLDSLLIKFSSLDKIKRIIGYTLRFIYNLKNPHFRKSSFVTIDLDNSLMVLVKHVQQISFSDDLDRFVKNKLLSKPLRKLSPFLDESGILRVGGRLKNSQLSYDQKFPALLPRNSRLTDLIIEDYHNKHFHPGAQTLQHLLAQKLWILSPKRAIRSIVGRCRKCWRLNPKPYQPPMGNLPACRISQVKPFSNVGIDFGGPFSILMSKHRGAKTTKAYLCLFVCLTTKALHLELASDLSTEAFLAALRRFIARRGRCSKICSDNGTNFVGASKYLNQIMHDACSEEAIDWQFNPPAAPHFGGIFEAGIKSVKTHLSRVIGEQILTFEELYTVFVQIESLLNSRPLTPLSSDPNDLTPLTPGHFLTLEPISALPDPDLSHLKINRLSRWQLLQRLHQDFWSRWNLEYLHTLQQKGKWTDPSTIIIPGTLVVIKSNLTPPTKWQLGRIVEVFPGADGVTRVASVRTAQGVFKRAVVKLCPLPLN